MRKVSHVVALATALLANVAGAQEEEAEPPPARAKAVVATKPMSLGVKVGLAFAWWSGDNINDSAVKATMGFMGGGVLVYRLSPNISVAPELLFAQKGFETKGVDPKVTVTMNYISAPVLLRAGIPVQDKVHLFVYGGPELAFILTADASAPGQGSEDFKDNVAVFELSLNIGAGAEIGLKGGQSLVFDLRYGFGLTTIDDTAAEEDIKNQVFSLNGGVLF